MLVGFRVALALGWVYDFTPTGVKRTQASEHALLIREPKNQLE